MRFDLATMIRRTRNPRRSQIVLRPIIPTATQAGDLYAAAFKPVITAWQRAVERLAAGYARSLPVQDGASFKDEKRDITDSIFDLESILASIGDDLSRLVLAITPSLRDWAVRAEQLHRDRWRGAVLTATNIDVGTLLGSGDLSEDVGTAIARNVALIRSVSDDTRAKVSDIVLRGYQARQPAAAVAKEMREAVGLSRKRALRISADQATKLSARLDQARQEQAGIGSFKWRWSHKLHGRQIHMVHDGKVYAWDALPQVDGKDDAPGRLPFCGCRAQAVINLE